VIGVQLQTQVVLDVPSRAARVLDFLRRGFGSVLRRVKLAGEFL
jgi:hypothetical protein